MSSNAVATTSSNFGHGKDTLASVLVVLNLLAFAYHTVAALAVLA